MKKQAGLKVFDDGSTVQIKLYNTVVFEKCGDYVKLAHGSWVTQSTAKAINRALDAFNVPGGVFRRKDTMYYKGPNGHVTEIDSSLTQIRVR